LIFKKTTNMTKNTILLLVVICLSLLLTTYAQSKVCTYSSLICDHGWFNDSQCVTNITIDPNVAWTPLYKCNCEDNWAGTACDIPVGVGIEQCWSEGSSGYDGSWYNPKISKTMECFLRPLSLPLIEHRVEVAVNMSMHRIYVNILSRVKTSSIEQVDIYGDIWQVISCQLDDCVFYNDSESMTYNCSTKTQCTPCPDKKLCAMFKVITAMIKPPLAFVLYNINDTAHMSDLSFYTNMKGYEILELYCFTGQCTGAKASGDLCQGFQCPGNSTCAVQHGNNICVCPAGTIAPSCQYPNSTEVSTSPPWKINSAVYASIGALVVISLCFVIVLCQTCRRKRKEEIEYNTINTS